MSTSAWRTLTPEQLAAEPEARFGGAIALIFFGALLLLLVLLAAIAAVLTNREILNAIGWMSVLMKGAAANNPRLAPLAYTTALQISTLFAWAAVFVVATVFRLRAGATLAAILFGLCLLAGPLGMFTAYVAIGTSIIVIATAQLPHLTMYFVAAVSYWSYMHDGRRPNLYFRRRVRV